MGRIRDPPITMREIYYFSRKVVYKLHTAGQQSDKEHSPQASRAQIFAFALPPLISPNLFQFNCSQHLTAK